MISVAIITSNGEDCNNLKSEVSACNDINVVKTGRDGFDIIMTAASIQPNVIIIDYNLGSSDGALMAKIVKQRSPMTAIVTLAFDQDFSIIDKAFKCGIRGFLFDRKDIKGIISVVKTVFYGGFHLGVSKDEMAFRYLCDFNRETKARLGHNILTVTEKNIFSGILNGYNDKEIAADLNMNVASLRNIICKVRKKTGLITRSQMIVYAFLEGHISFDNEKKNKPIGDLENGSNSDTPVS